MGQIKDLTNMRFGRLTAIKIVGKNKYNYSEWLCKCDCGNEKITNVSSLLNGSTKSCGCLQKEMAIKSNSTHKKSTTKLYWVWRAIKQRCYNINNKHYHNYGARGITMCDEWRNSFENFYNWSKLNGYNENAINKTCTIDRINNDGNYEPNNCRWVDMKVQSNNRRKRKGKCNV